MFGIGGIFHANLHRLGRVLPLCQIYIYIFTQDNYIHKHTHTHTHTHTNTHITLYTYIHTHIHTYIHKHTHITLYTYIHTYIHIHTYITYIHTRRLGYQCVCLVVLMLVVIKHLFISVHTNFCQAAV